MVKKLFFLEFRRALTPFLLFILASFGALAVSERAYKYFQNAPSTIVEIVNMLFVSLIIIYGFPSGARTFSPAFRETHLLFLQSLPLRRERVWAALVLANLSASLLSLAALFVFRPSLLTTPPGEARAIDVLAVAMVGYLLLFSAGCCFSLLFAKAILNYILGYLLTLAASFEIFLLLIYSGSDPGFPVEEYFSFPASFDLPLAVVAYSLLVIIYLAFSLYFFASGEFNLTKVQIKNSLSLAAFLLALFVALSACVDSGLFAVFDKWATTSWGPEAEVSPEGTYLLVVERRSDHLQFARISILEAKTGNLVGTIRQRGAAGIGWSNEGDAVNVVVRGNSPLYRVGYILPGSDELVRFSPHGRQLGRWRFLLSRVLAGAPSPGGKGLLVVRRGDEGRILSIDGRTGALEELASGVVKDWSQILKVSDGQLVIFENLSVPSRAWLVGSQAKEIQWVPRRANEQGGMCMVGGTLYSSEEACQKAASDLAPFRNETKGRLGTQRHGVYLFGANQKEQFGNTIADLDKGGTVFYVQPDLPGSNGEFLVFDRQKGDWRPVAESIALDLGGGSSTDIPRIAFGLRFVTVDSSLGLATYYVERGDRLVGYLYDAGIDKALELESIPKPHPPEIAETAMRRFENMRGVGIFLWTRSPERFNVTAFRYVPHSGEVTKVPWMSERAPNQLLYMDDRGNQVHASSNPVRIVWLGADQTERQLWPPAAQ